MITDKKKASLENKKEKTSSKVSFLSFKNFTDEQILVVYSLLICVANGILIVFMLSRANSTVTGTLNNYGLSLNNTAGNTFETYLSLTYLFVGASIAANIAIFSLIFAKRIKMFINQPDQQKIKPVENIETLVPLDNEIVSKEMPSEDKKQEEPTETQVALPPKKQEFGEDFKESKICPYCHNSYSKSSVSLDLSGGKAKLIDVCPHCKKPLENKAL